MLRIPELVAGGLVDRHGARTGGGIRHLPGVQLPGGKAKFAVVVRHGLHLLLRILINEFNVYSISTFQRFFKKQKAPSGYEGAR